MLQVLLIFILISVVRCVPNCAGFSTFTHNPALINDLPGPWLKVYTSGTVVDCERETWSIGQNNELNAYVQSLSCCLRVACDSSNPNYFECNVTSLQDGCPVLPGTSPLPSYGKLIEKFGSGNNLCLIASFCRDTRDGLYVICRQLPTALISLLITVYLLLLTLVGLFAPIPTLAPVNQANCIFLNSCPP